MKSEKFRKIFKIVGGLLLITGIILIITGVTLAFNADPFESFDNTPTFFIIGGITIFIGFVMLMIVTTLGTFNKFKDLSKSVLSDEVDPNSDSFIDLVKSTIKKQKEAEVRAHTCEYCGGSLRDDETKCPNCGAAKKR